MTKAHDTNVNVLVGELVHQHMWRDKITQTQVAQALGVGQPAIARKLRGERPFTIDELLAVAAFLDRPITDLLPNAENPRPEGPGGGTVRHQGFEPRTRWYVEKAKTEELWGEVVPLFVPSPQFDDEKVAA